jgi:hypothetical protein
MLDTLPVNDLKNAKNFINNLIPKQKPLPKEG